MQLEQKIVFAPPLNEEQPRNFIELFENVIQKIFSLGSDTKRVTDLETDTIVEKLVINVLHRPKQEENYYEFLDNDEELKSVLKSLRQHLKDGVDKIMKITEDFNRYADLWLLNIEKELEDFTLHGPVPEEEEGDYVGDDDISILTVVELKPPTEEEFKTEISHFDQLFKIINDLESIIEVESWLILDITLFKDSLLEIIRNWQSSYKKKFIEMKHLGMLRKLQDEE